MAKAKTLVDFYFQIKGLEEGGGLSRWSWPPLLSGKIAAPDKTTARQSLEETLKQTLPLRVLKDNDSAPFILSLREITADDTRTQRLFEIQHCVQCHSTFRVIDKYNDAHATDKGFDYCSYDCREFHREGQKLLDVREDQAGAYGYIYKITHRHTEQCYIGKTNQAFTLRWWQHFSQAKDTKFSRAIAASKITDWCFEIIEEIRPEDVLGESQNKAKPSRELKTQIVDYTSVREQYWIDHYDSISQGYNSVVANKAHHLANMTEAQQSLSFEET